MKKYFSLLVLLALFSVQFVAAFIYSSPTHAADVLECVSGGTSTVKSKDVCQTAYAAAKKTGNTASANCSKKSGTNKSDCNIGARAGAKAQQAIVKAAATSNKKLGDVCNKNKLGSSYDACVKVFYTAKGTKGAEDGHKLADVCGKKPKKATTAYSACQKAWQAAAVAKAKKVGASAGSADVCKDILGGDKAVKACKAEYTKAKNAADAAGINKCDTVVTYFDFDCGTAKTTSGGRQNPIVSLLLTILSWVTGLVSMAAIGGIIYGGILYAGAQDNSGQTQKGIMYVVNSTIALLLWFAAFALINYIVPGGLFT